MYGLLDKGMVTVQGKFGGTARWGALLGSDDVIVVVVVVLCCAVLMMSPHAQLWS